MTVQEFYQQLITKGYSNANIEEVKKNLMQSDQIEGALDNHILQCLELDRLKVFQLWYGDSYLAMLQGSSMEEFLDGIIAYQVQYILNNN